MKDQKFLKFCIKMFSQIVIIACFAASTLASEHGHHAPQPYKFGYSIKDHHGEQHREESGDGGHGVKGSYGFTDARGVHRQVNYVADHAGFRAQVKTNEPGTANQNPAAVHIISDAPAQGHYLGGLGYGYNGYAAPAAVPEAVGYGLGGYAGYGGLGYAGYGGLGYAGGLGYGGYGYGLGGPFSGLGYARYGY